LQGVHSPLTIRTDRFPVAIVNASFVRRFLPRVDPIGKRLQYGPPSNPWITIVGVVADVRHTGLEQEADPELFLPYTQNFPVNLGIAVRTNLPPSTLVSAIRQQIAQIDPAQPIFDIATMEHRLSESTGSRRTQTALISCFALIALCLAVVGVYGVLSVVTEAPAKSDPLGSRSAQGDGIAFDRVPGRYAGDRRDCDWACRVARDRSLSDNLPVRCEAAGLD